MKWDCGTTEAEKHAAREQWHDWFAWYPVRVASHDCRWLEVVQQRQVWPKIGYPTWEYRAKDGV